MAFPAPAAPGRVTFSAFGENPFLLDGIPKIFHKPYSPISGPLTLFKDSPVSSRTILNTSANPRETFERICAIVAVAKRGTWDPSPLQYLMSPTITSRDRPKIRGRYSRISGKWRDDSAFWLQQAVETTRDYYCQHWFDRSDATERAQLWADIFEDNPCAIAFHCFGPKAVDVDWVRIFDPSLINNKESTEGKWRFRFKSIFTTGCEDAYLGIVAGEDSDLWWKFYYEFRRSYNQFPCMTSLDRLPIKWQETVDWEQYDLSQPPPALCSDDDEEASWSDSDAEMDDAAEGDTNAADNDTAGTNIESSTKVQG